MKSIFFVHGVIMNRCSKLLRCVCKIPNTFTRRISQAEPKKLAPVVKPKMHPALGMATEYQYIGQTFIWRSGTSNPVSNNPSYSSRVCVRCALKIWNTVELLYQYHYDENCIFSIKTILKHKQVACMRRKKLLTFFKYLFLFQRYWSF